MDQQAVIEGLQKAPGVGSHYLLRGFGFSACALGELIYVLGEEPKTRCVLHGEDRELLQRHYGLNGIDRCTLSYLSDRHIPRDMPADARRDALIFFVGIWEEVLDAVPCMDPYTTPEFLLQVARHRKTSKITFFKPPEKGSDK